MDIKFNIKNIFSSLKSKSSNVEPQATWLNNNIYPPIETTFFTGEKTPGEMGAPKNYVPEYTYLRTRSWQVYTESELAKLIIGKYVTWVIGNGLKIQPEPNEIVLKQEGINLPEDFIQNTESRFNIWANSNYSDYKKHCSLNKLASECYKHAIVGGDCLVINRFENNSYNCQIIDGEHVATPHLKNDLITAAKKRGNKIVHGVEINKRGEHVAYYILNEDGTYSRIERYGKKSGYLQAFLVYGSMYRIDSVRGMPIMSAVLETIKKIDRYKEATVGSAEERQKIAFAIEHGINSTGKHPMLDQIQQASRAGMGEAPETKTTDAYESTATKVAMTTGKQTINMPVDSTLKSLESKNELYFKDFYETNAMFLCAAVGIPYEVALSKFGNNYSASRAAIKDWEYNMKTSRSDFAKQFYQPFYNNWLESQILLGKVQATGYMKAMVSKNLYALEAFRSAKFLGANVPNIDPVKEVTAERLKLGDDVTPLTDLDQATESIGSGDYASIMRKVKQQQKLSDGVEIKKESIIKNNNKQ